MQNIFYQLIEEQTKKSMLAKVRKDYILKTLDPAIAMEEQERPKRALIMTFFTIFGVFLGILYSLLRPSIKPK